MYALTLQRKDDTKTWILSLPSHFRPDRALIVTESSFVERPRMCRKLRIWSICTVCDLKFVFLLVSLAQNMMEEQKTNKFRAITYIFGQKSAIVRGYN
jgi:hypothetical protein